MSLLSRLAVQAARAYGMLVSGATTNVPANFLVVAGGGGAGDDLGGAGGGGGLRTSAGASGGGASAEPTITLSTLNTYSIVVGSGGAGATAGGANGTNGGNSVISGTGLTTITSVGGGGGAGDGTGGGIGTAQSGGSGGGAASGSGYAGGAGTANQGFAGGSNPAGSYQGASAGGGGAGAAGTGRSGSTNTGGNGGNGVQSSISGTATYYAGGGAGGTGTGGTAGTAGLGGGGTGSTGSGNNGGNGGTNLGGGGGGGSASGANGGNGGSGIVIISYTSATPRFVGGTITTSGGNQIHTFTSSGTLSPITPITASYLVVAGGGAGGALKNGAIVGGGGGGAGGLLTSSTTLYSGATYVVTVGAGGAGVSAGTSGSGSNSIVSGTGLTTITATGGGGGGWNDNSSGIAGGSGGGGANGSSGGAGTLGQGNNGGGSSSSGGSGGGGGAGAVGASSSNTVGANGGAGTASSITGTSVTYAGGGGGGGYNAAAGLGGAGGGGDAGAANTTGSSGTSNLGGGGGGCGGSSTATAKAGGNGGSGVVIISYAGSQVFNGGLVTTSGGNTIHTFTSTGALTPLTNNLNNSLRFRSSATANLTRTPTLTTNRRTYTWSSWVKRGALPSSRMVLFIGDDGTIYTYCAFSSSNQLEFYHVPNTSGTEYKYVTSAVFRDPSAWYHVVFAIDTTQATAGNRVKIYVNGVQQTISVTTAYGDIPQNTDTFINTNNGHTSFGWNRGSSPFDGYATDVNFIDGQALEPYYFGNNDANGVWKPIQYKGTYGTNGFYLTFGNTTSTTTLGYDSSPNGNNWTTNNISLTAGVTYDAMTDVPTNTSATVANYAVMNPLVRLYGTATLSDANLKINDTSTGGGAGYASIAVTSGKFYYEFSPSAVGKTSGMGVTFASTYSFGYDGCYVNNGSVSNTTGGSAATYASYTTNDVIGVAFDADAGKVWFYKNGTIQAGDPVAGTGSAFTWAANSLVTATYAMDNSAGTVGINVNFGQRPFAYTPPTGYVALNTFNLPTPTILQGNKYMDAVTYNGSDGSQRIVNQGQFYPDFIWAKSRNTATNNILVDSIRGGNLFLSSNTTSADTTSTGLATWASNGITWTGGASGVNAGGQTYVNWMWNAGNGSSSSNTSGSITSTVSVNTTAGFSVVTYTGTGANATVGHGLGVAPKMIVTFVRNNAGLNHVTYHASLGNTQSVWLNLTNAATTDGAWNNTTPTSTVFSVAGSSSNVNGNGYTIVAYCWAEIAGFSRFTSYVGNGSTDGPFVYLGFRPKFILARDASVAGQEWTIYDTSRSVYNQVGNKLSPDLNAVESVWAGPYDILSNGFKLRTTDIRENRSGSTFIVAAFAEHPFKNSNAR